MSWYRRVGDYYETTRDIRWSLAKGGGHFRLVVPAGFRFDVSVPWFLTWALDPHDCRFLEAAAFHDYAVHRLQWGRVASAVVFSESLRAAGVSRWTRLAMVLAVVAWKFQ